MKLDKAAITGYYKDLPSWAKGVVVVGGLFIVYAVGKKVFRVVFPDSSSLRNQQLAQNISQEINRLKRKHKQTFPDSQYQIFASSIFEGMRYCVGDDYGSVESTMKKMMNDLDVALLIQAYGFRKRACFGIDAGGTDDLFTSVKAELGNEWGGITGYRVTNINNDWTRKGITYRV